LTDFEAEMREQLLALSTQLEVAGTDQAAEVVELDQSRMGRLSRMDALQAQAMAQASGRRRELMLRQVASALARLERGEYGTCQSCDEAIHRKRLEFDPTVILCIACAEQSER
jgi:DnaK suppressor protein